MSTETDTGTGIGRPKKPLACPRCAVPLESVRIDDVAVDRCATCHGLWFDVNELDRVMARGAPGLRAMAATEAATEAAPVAAAAPAPAPPAAPKLACPICGIPMMRLKTLEEPRLDVDGCKVCYGRWVDSAEFRKLHAERPGFLGSLLHLLEKWF